MSRYFASIPALAGCLLLFTLTACVQVTRDPRALDIERLNNAIVADNVSYVRTVIESGMASVNHRIPAPGYMEGTPLLTIAARSASLSVLRYLLAAGANVNARTPANETAVMLAAFFFDDDAQAGPSYQRHEAAVRLLVSAGAHLENDPHHYTPLSYASYQGHERIVRFLLERGARVDADADGENGTTYINTPLMMAAMMGRFDAVRRLLQAGADARIRVHQGHTALELAAKYNHRNLVPVLQCAERRAAGLSSAHGC